MLTWCVVAAVASVALVPSQSAPDWVGALAVTRVVRGFPIVLTSAPDWVGALAVTCGSRGADVVLTWC